MLKTSNLDQMLLYTKELTTRDLILTTITYHLMRWMPPLRLLTLVTLAGKLTLANSRKIIICTIVIPMLSLSRSVTKTNSLLLMKLRRRRKRNMRLRKKPRQVHSDKAQTSIKSTLLQLNTNKNMPKLTTSSTVRSQSLTTGETLTATISPVRSVTKSHVDLATLLPSLRLLRPDSSWNTVKKCHKFHHKCFLIATIWMRVAKVDGHISTLTLPNMVTLFPKNVLHIKLLLLSPHAVSIVLVPQSPKLKVLTNSEVPMVRLPKREWWKKSLETVLLTPSSRLQTYSPPTEVVFYPLTVSKISKSRLQRVALPKLQPPM